MVLLCIDIGVFFLAPRHLLSNRPGGPSRHGGGRTEQDRAGASWRQPQRRGAAYLGVVAADRSSWPCLPIRLGVAGPTDDNARRLIGSSVMAGPASVPRRH